LGNEWSVEVPKKIRFLAAAAVVPLISLILFSAVSASNAADATIEPTPTVSPTPNAFQVEVVVETQGIGIPDDVLMETDFGNRGAYRHEILGPNHYRDFLQVQLNSSVMWIFDHEGDLGIGGQRNDESWVLMPIIVETPITVTISLHNPAASCQDLAIAHCNYVSGTGYNPVYILDHNKSYSINLRVDYTRGASYDQDSFKVASTIK
jgi:hypothetical protein